MSSSHQKPIQVVLVETAPADRPGSMQRYADLVETCFEHHPDVIIERVSVAPTAKSLQSWPARLRNLKHHATICLRTRALHHRRPRPLFHVVDGSHAYAALWLPKDRTIVTAHDVIPLLQSLGKFAVPPPGRQARWLIQQSLRGLARSTRIVAVSKRTLDDLAEYACISAEKMQVVPLALPRELQPPGSNAEIAMRVDDLRKNSEPFLFHIGNNGFYKNRGGVVRIFDLVRQQLSTPLRLKLAGPPLDDALWQLIQERQLEQLVDVLVDVDDAHLVKLYQSMQTDKLL